MKLKRTVAEVESILQHTFQSLVSNSGSSNEAEIAALLNPSGFEPVIEVYENGKKKRRDASVDNLDFETIEYKVYFIRVSDQSNTPRLLPSLDFTGDSVRPQIEPRDTSRKMVPPPLTSAPPKTAASSVQQRLTMTPPPPPFEAATSSGRGLGSSMSAPSPEDELCSALEEVERQAKPFVALKWFRDDVLANKNFAWGGTTEERQAVLARAVESGRVVTSRIPNPRSPYPTTTIRLNRSRAAVGDDKPRYNPRPIRGEGLSETILRDRGTR